MATFNMSNVESAVSHMKKGARVSMEMTVLAILAIIVLVQAFVQLFSREKPPLAGFRSRWEPDFLVRLRFSWGALPIIHEGYDKVRRYP